MADAQGESSRWLAILRLGEKLLSAELALEDGSFSAQDWLAAQERSILQTCEDVLKGGPPCGSTSSCPPAMTSPMLKQTR